MALAPVLVQRPHVKMRFSELHVNGCCARCDDFCLTMDYAKRAEKRTSHDAVPLRFPSRRQQQARLDTLLICADSHVPPSFYIESFYHT
jgi:hypothetical protein